MQKTDIQAGRTYEGPRRRGHRVIRTVEAIIPHPGYATMVRFTERFLSESTRSREVTLKSFASWAVREAST